MATLRDEYDGPFDPGVELRDFSRRTLARLGREYLLHGHLQDRVGMPLVLARHSPDDMAAVAIEEWMAASPVYSHRMQRALNFRGSDVPTIFKNIQLDIGAPHQFMDFRYKVDDAQHGEFWLDHCGALMDVEPMGEDFVVRMCHDIEDPTFDATAGATHPFAKVRPIHRPPRVPADRAPHCHWRVTIDADDGDAAEVHPSRDVVEQSEIARVAIDDPGIDAEPGGWFDYSGAFDPDFTLEDLSHRALVVALQEVGVQTHLLAHAYLHAVARRWGAAEAIENAPQVSAGTAGVGAARLPAVLGIAGDDALAIAKLLQLHPLLQPRTYVAPVIEPLDDNTLRFALRDAPCFHERDGLSWFAPMASEPSPVLDAIARAVNPRASSAPDSTRDDEHVAWRIAIDPSAAPARPAPSVELARISTGATVTFLPRRDLRN